MVKERNACRVKLNNSYETEPSTSNSSTDDASSNTWQLDYPFGQQQLKDYLYPGVGRFEHKHESAGIKLKISNESDKKPRSMQPLPREKSFEFLDLLLQDYTANTEETFGSEDIPDQDIVFQHEMRKFIDIFNTMRENDDLLNVSQFSIEPSSDNEDEDESPKKRTTPIIKSSRIVTLSLNEDSCNAVDLPFARKCDELKEIMTDLSFNGRIPGEISQANVIDGETSPVRDGDGKVNAAVNVSGNSQLETFQLETSGGLNCERSPDLFADDDDDDEDTGIDTVCVDAKETDKRPEPSTYFADDSLTSTHVDQKDVSAAEQWEQMDKTASRRIKTLLSGVLPPPTITFCQYDIGNMLNLYKTNSEILQKAEGESLDSVDSAFSKNDFIPDGLNDMEWPDVRGASAHGIHYNRTKYSENMEMMYMNLAERYIGHQTTSSFTFDASAHVIKKPPRKIAASPGNRLSHLAKRRAAFSSASLKAHAPMPNTSNLGRKPCVIDASKLMKKSKPITPRRRTMSVMGRRTPGRKTPGSSKKAKGLPLIKPTTATATRETSKRALFLSPTHEEVKLPKFTPEVSVRVEKSKRALFSPPHRIERSISTMAYSSSNSSLNEFGIGVKRRRENDDENVEPQNRKISKSIAPSTSRMLANSKAASENALHNQQQLSATHKQKLLWAVSTALTKKSVTSSHENFNKYASVLAKVVKRLFLETMTSKAESTSATMLRLADRLVFWVIQGKTVDEIYLSEKNRNEAAKIATRKLSGYIGPDEYASQKERQNDAATSTARHSLNANLSNVSTTSTEAPHDERQPLTNSSSKNNLTSNALRENHDSKSAQKNPTSFSGRNQKNLSPYTDKSRTTGNLNKSTKVLVGNSLHSSLMKVKRQISFDN